MRIPCPAPRFLSRHRIHTVSFAFAIFSCCVASNPSPPLNNTAQSKSANDSIHSEPTQRMNGSCVSQGGRFPAFSLDGKLPRSIGKKSQKEDFPFCRIYHGHTCCGRAHAEMAFVAVRRLLIGGEGSEQCVALWEALECATCHPSVGTQPGPPAICQSFCDKVFDACREAFFASEPHSQALVPCGPRDVLCARAHEWASNGSQLCDLAGFRSIDDLAHVSKLIDDGLYCFDGNPESSGADFGGRPSKPDRPSRGRGFAGEFSKWAAAKWHHLVGGKKSGENVVWLVAGLVLTAAAAFMRWTRFRNRRRRAALLATKSLNEVRAKQQAEYSSLPKANGRGAKKKK